MSVETIYMPLLNEGTEAWAPVTAERCSIDTFLVRGPVPEGQLWRFGPDCVVAVEPKTFADGTTGLVVTQFIGIPAIMADGWRGVEAEINKIVAQAAQPFEEDTIANASDLLNYLRGRCPTPDTVDKGYWDTICFTWGNIEIEVFGDHIEVYRLHDQRTEIWHEAHRAGDPFSPKVLAELGAP